MKKTFLLLPIILICLAQAAAGNSTIIAGTAQSGEKPYWGASESQAPRQSYLPHLLGNQTNPIIGRSFREAITLVTPL